MTASVEFYFDFASPYGYLASERIEHIAEQHGRSVMWRPFLVGAAMKVSERKPLAWIPLVGDYAVHDVKRFARYWDIPFVIPSHWPIATVNACRAFYLLEEDDHDAAKQLARALYHAYFRDNQDISDPETVVAVASELGHDPTQIAEGIQTGPIKQKLRAVNDEALARGVFGSPFIIVDSESFWGADRLDQVDQWLSRGGW
ncbi:MAG: 2-hydroxychromene-2-carboxylate isomerase [Proteobacteria bacterium]|nr:2-hydroxychromene-2-carboxylate isomerase [Pseudomonadota bacterium]MBT5819347.1 2-hydroxychromene-2-carboxylate isomerase [Pseudomonadota bacterium]